MSDDVSLPPLPSPSAGPEELRDALRALILWAQAREPLAEGPGLNKFLTGPAAAAIPASAREILASRSPVQADCTRPMRTVVEGMERLLRRVAVMPLHPTPGLNRGRNERTSLRGAGRPHPGRPAPLRSQGAASAAPSVERTTVSTR